MTNVLITGGSGYLGGSLLAYLKQNPTVLPPGTTLYGLVRNEEQAQKTRSHYGIDPLILDLASQQAITNTFLEKNITVVAFLIDARRSEVQVRIIKALAKVQAKMGRQAHFIQTAGAKGFSSHAGFPLEPPVEDVDGGLYEIHKEGRGKESAARSMCEADVAIVEAAEEFGVRAYIVAPCIVYGEGEGFGNRISIQTVAIVKAAKATRRVYNVNQGRAVWPVCHVRDQSALYARLLHNILSGVEVNYNKKGFFLASPGAVAWRDLYAAMAKALLRKGLIDDDEVHDADEKAVAEMARGLGCEPKMVAFSLGGVCTWVPRHGKSIGWKPEHAPEHILEAADDEVELILKNI
ncbi:hypothetical protein M409DRAFT_26105 [Zasmidium cellare ATCC 36951]|uniref:NAD-dependent epimerase/dehydratase domain-containing protein n=1 Tax=Zasmidium cellare ATCC 36951 TaxID=1080233 RepID=A0A6A6C8M1_ZASCE|nr:uncharacterized protein M409DRAFT_26105 [Zasmidium cellare ATCC 36951]KAF2163494.1 hypothetical protein M409DRAFT_26105 [Zasmidium cellare ATCC 36951]